ncbi:hypothetical protein GYMLUDRAFT_254721 [Collybiopsis luxurians FD-317 M1]|nr:hypothetical protein GYMLUDRAFT_254721 [Collybiopsis luxurians FD-317 M1]
MSHTVYLSAYPSVLAAAPKPAMLLLTAGLTTRNFASVFLPLHARDDNSTGTIDVGFKTEKPYVPLDVTRGDLLLGSIVLGFFFGFLAPVVWSAVRETHRARKFTLYVFMIWLEITADIVFAVITWVYLAGYLGPGLHVFATIIACWICQVQCLLQIIANRLSILLSKRKHRLYLKFTVAGIVTLVSVSTAFIWIPAQLQINHTFIETNHWWDRFEKSVYLLTDLVLNALFIRTVKKRLIDHGLHKYDKVMKFNEYIVVVSIGMDILLMGVTALKNPFVYCQFHPVVYIIKLQIEMTMAQLIIKVARSTGINVVGPNGKITKADVPTYSQSGTQMAVHINTHVYRTDGADNFEMQSAGDRKVDVDLESQSEIADGHASDILNRV